MKYPLVSSGLLSLCLSLPPIAMSAEPVPRRNIDNIVVTSNRIPTERARVGTTTYVMTAEEIETRQYRFTLDALRAIPGITISQTGGLGGVASVRVRGAASAQTLVRVDGIIVNDPTSPGGGFDFSTLDTSDIAMIEVFSGPQSTMYGSDAIGGVINITTKSTSGAPLLTGYAEGGSYDSRRLEVESGKRWDVFGYRVSANHFESDGYSKADEADGNPEKDRFENLTLSGQLSADFTESLALVLTGRYIDSATDIDNFGGSGGDATGLTSQSKQLWLGATLTADAFSGRLNNILRVNYLDTDYSLEAFFFATQGEQSTIDYQGVFSFSDSYKLLFGAEYEQQSVTDPSGFTPKRELDSTGLFAMLQFAPVESLDFTAGLRRDDYDAGADGDRVRYSEFPAENTAQLTAAWRLPAPDTVIRASWGQGFRAPTIFQLTSFFPPATAPNLRLKPESSNGWDVGIEHTFGFWNLNTQLTYFRDDTDNLITYEDGRYENIDRTRRKGVELGIYADMTATLNIAVSGAYISATDLATGQQLTGVPELTGFVNLTYMPVPRASIYADLTVSSDRPAFGGLTQPGFGVVHLGGSYALNQHFALFGRIHNLLDKQYQEVLGFGTADRSYYVGVELSLQ